MKLRHLFMSLLAGAALLTACQDDEKDLGLPEITISQRDLDLGPEMTTKTLTVEASRDWTVSTAADWISVNPSKGKAYKQTSVTITILANKTYNRTATVKFDIGYDSKSLVVTQEGELGEKSNGTGTVEDPYTVDGVLAFIETLGTAESEEVVFVAGKVTTISEAYTTQFGNATFTITEDGKGNSEAFTCYRVKYLGNKGFAAEDTPIKEGDEVVVAGKVYNYNGKTKETVSGTGYLYSLNGENRGTGGGGQTVTGDAVYVNDFDKEKATQTFGTNGNAWPYLDQFDGWAHHSGSGIANVDYAFNAMSVRSNSESSGTHSEYTGSGSNNLFFGADGYFWVKNIALGEGLNYTLSFGSEKYLYGASDNTFNHSEFKVYVSDTGEKWVELQYAFPNGDKSGVWDLASSKFTVPSGTTTLHIYVKVSVGSAYRLDDLRLDPSEEEGTAIDFTNGIDLGTGGNGGGGGEGGGDEQARGTGTLDDPYNPAGAKEAVKDLTWTSNTDYQTTSEVYVKGKICKIATSGTYTEGGTFGNASFYISETGTETGTQFYAFRILYLGNKKFETGQTDIKVGDEVIIYGKLMNYRGNTPETVSGSAYLYSLNGSTEGGSGDGGNGGGDGGNTGSYVFKKVNTVTSGKAYLIYASGKIAKPIDASKNYGYLNVTDATVTDNAITLSSVENAFVFESAPVAEGFTIKQVSDGRYLYMSGTYNSFNVSANPTENTLWTVGTDNSSNLLITNTGMNKFIQYSTTHTSFGSYPQAQDGGVYPELYELEGDLPSGGDGGNGNGDGGNGDGGNGNGDGGNTGDGLTITTNSNLGFTAASDQTYGTGFKATTTEGYEIAFYKYQSNTTPVTPTAQHMRVYKSSVLVINAPTGTVITKMVFQCDNDANSTSYTNEWTMLEGGGSCEVNKTAHTVTWTGSTTKFVGQASAQNRVVSITFTTD